MNIRAKIFGGPNEGAGESILRTKQKSGAVSDSLESIAVAREARRTANSRFESRHRLANESAQLSHRGKRREVEIINLSGGGAMINRSFDPGLWDEVHLHLGDEDSLECAVCWIRDDRLGLEFAHETRLDCSPGKQADLLREVVIRNFPDIEFNPPEDVPPATNEPEQRLTHRHPFIWSASLHFDHESTPVRLRNISETGAMIQGEFALPIGGQPLLDFGEAGSAFGTVAWTFGDQAGLKFDQPYDLSLLARSRPAVAEAERNVPSYVDCEQKGEPWAEHWDRLSPSDLKAELEGFLKR